MIFRSAGLLAVAVGLIIGLVLGLVYTWRIDPVQLYNTTPPLLRADYRHEWIRLAALGYIADGDLERALERLDELEEADIQQALAALIESYASQGKPAGTMRALSWLAQQLGVETSAMLVYLGTPPPSPTHTPPPSPAPSPTPLPIITLPTPAPTLSPFVSPLPVPSPHQIISQTVLCEGTEPQLQVRVQTTLPGEEDITEPLPGTVLWLTWPNGADRAVTGLRPEIDPGYADFILEPGLSYALSIGEPNAPILSGLMAPPCPSSDGEEPLLGSWQVVVNVEQP